MKIYLAVDLGAGSGRVMAGRVSLDDEGSNKELFELEELNRFENNGIDIPGGSFWNIINLYQNIVEGIRIGVQKYGSDVKGIGIDTWGCDYGLLSKNGRLLGLPHQYRDPRSEGMQTVIDERVGLDKIYSATGICSAFYNTSEHLVASTVADSTALEGADKIVFIPDLLSYWLTGEIVNERTVTSTSQLYNPVTKDWAWEMIEGLGLPRDMFGKIVDPGSIIGNVREDLATKFGCGEIPVIASPSHDTASAVAGIPIGGREGSSYDAVDVWISSGTWSIMGVEVDEPIITEEGRKLGFSNEVGVEDSIRYLKNISGLWMIQECRRYWQSQGEDYNYAALANLADEAEPFVSFVDPDDIVFASPGKMPEKIQEYCRKTGQKVPETKGAILRTASESLALKYRVVFDHLADLVQSTMGKPLGKVYMGGGGIQNQMLAQNAADAIGREVIAGPVEATSCGNLITQMVGTGHIGSIQEGRQMILDSFEMKKYVPQDPEVWDATLVKFKDILGL